MAQQNTVAGAPARVEHARTGPANAATVALPAIPFAAADAAAPTLPSAAGARGGERTGQEATLSDRVVSYRIDATLDAVKHAVSGQERMTWRNRGDRPVSHIYFHRVSQRVPERWQHLVHRAQGVDRA